MAKASPEQQLKAFVEKTPQSKFTFDSERDSQESEICRKLGKDSKECITLRMNSKRLFESMQGLGFFCALPMDPSRTHMECIPVPKN
ncbi:hypothetical protein BJ322DRAFT_79945 [Thelephora terrestris]|uniref:Uncharacterized protein n=1 Tax=Thelephora terrestris TaxID=56493 RepID=A0A9P6HQU9_9AGAM|nr:hypothetical protein BJ322DRAFT_79945 [Thelephora terrestris]